MHHGIRSSPLELAPAWSLAVVAMLSVQFGAALSVLLFPMVGVAGTVWLRLTIGAVLFLLWVRPRVSSWRPRTVRVPVLLGVVSGLMTLSFMAAVDRLPLGTVVAIEFLGPLLVAARRSPSRSALTWPLLALVGVLALTEPWTGATDLLGIVFALGSAVAWATYILLTQHVGDRFTGVDSLAISTPVAALTTAVLGVPQALGHIDGQVLLIALAAALLLPLIPYTLELYALRRMTAAAFGTLMALEPAFGWLIGAIALHQRAGAPQLIGLALVVMAGIGAARIGGRQPVNPPTIE